MPGHPNRLQILESERGKPALAGNSSKRLAQLEKGRATQAHAKGKINAGELNAIHTKANRAIGHTFHSIKGQG